MLSKNNILRKQQIKLKLFNFLVKKGKKNKAEKIIYCTLKLLQKENVKNSKKLFWSALTNVSPVITVKTLKTGKGRVNRKIQLPIFLNKKSRTLYAIKLLIKSDANKIVSPIPNRLKKIIQQLSIETTQKTNKTMYQSAHANYSTAHYRWF